MPTAPPCRSRTDRPVTAGDRGSVSIAPRHPTDTRQARHLPASPLAPGRTSGVAVSAVPLASRYGCTARGTALGAARLSLPTPETPDQTRPAPSAAHPANSFVLLFQAKRHGLQIGNQRKQVIDSHPG